MRKLTWIITILVPYVLKFALAVGFVAIGYNDGFTGRLVSA